MLPFVKQGAENQLKHAVGTMRPVSVAFEVIDNFRLYNAGVYTSPKCHSGPQVNSYCTVVELGMGCDDQLGVTGLITSNQDNCRLCNNARYILIAIKSVYSFMW